MSQSGTESVTSEISATIGAEMSEKIMFELVAEMSVSVSASVSSSISETTTRSFGYKEGTMITYPCTGGDYSMSIGLWQWITTSNDGKFITATDFMLCRFGGAFDEPPPCPLGACANSDCSVCEDGWQGE